MIRTINGDIPSVTGPILAHEHLRIDLRGNKNADVVLGPDEENVVVADLRDAAATHGLALVTDLTVPGSGRDVTALARMSRAANVPVVAATGFYWEPFPAPVMEQPLDALATSMVAELTQGVDGTSLRCGVIKVGTPGGPPDATATRLFGAAAEAAGKTGAAIITHTSSLDQIGWHRHFFSGAHVDPSRLLISHFGQGTPDLLRDIGRFGCFMGVDQIGFTKGPTLEELADLVAAGCAAGLVRQLIISSDMARRTRLSSFGGTSYGTMFSKFLPRLTARGISDRDIDIMMRDNPVRLLSLAPT